MDRTPRPLTLVNGVAIAAAYAVLGKLSMLLALAPGYASPVFPSAGLAITFAYLSGVRALPWVFLGSFILNLAGPREVNVGMFVGAAAAIAAASTLQAGFGGWLLRRVIGPDSKLDHVRDVAGFIVASLFACLISSSISVCVLTSQGIFASELLHVYWFNWWIGDLLGVLVMVPMLLAAFGRPAVAWRRRRAGIILPMLLAIPVAIYGYVQSARSEQSSMMSAFELDARQFTDLVQSNFDQQVFLLESLAEFLQHGPGPDDVTRAEYKAFLEPALKRYPMIKAVAWAPRVAVQERQDFVARQRTEIPGFAILERDANGALARAAERPVYFPAAYAEPMAGNEAALGFDLLSNDSRKQAVQSAIEGMSAVATRRVQLVDSNQLGILLLLPVRAEGRATGVVMTVLKVDNFMEALLNGFPNLSTVLSEQLGGEVIYRSARAGAHSAALSFPLAFGGRQYVLEASPTQAFLSANHGGQSWWLMVAGSAAVGLLGAIMLLSTGYTLRVERAVQSRTAELRREHDRCERLALEADAASRAKSRFLSKISHEMLTPLNGIIGMLELVSRTPLEEKQRVSLEMAEVSARQMHGLVNAALEFAALEAEDGETIPAEFHIAAVMNQLHEFFREHSLPDTLLTITVAPDVPDLLMGDQTRLLHVLKLLLDNALKFGKAGGQVHLDVCSSRETREYLWLQFSLRDEGPGIEREVLQRIFDPFVQGDDSLTRAHGGAGLGLPLARRIVYSMNGTIWAESEPGMGSTFRFTARFNKPGSMIGDAES